MPNGFIPVNTPQVAATGNTTQATPNISFIREDVRRMLPIWERIQDCLDGEDAIKAKATRYLPVPDAESGGTATDPRYKNYLLRAVYYNVTGRTLTGLVGQVFGRDSVINLPESLSNVEADAEGTGTSLEQQAKRALEYCLSKGRGALLADFPETDGPVTKAQIEAGIMRPIIKLYPPEAIINWRTRKVGARTMLSLVVLREIVDQDVDGFETKTTVTYRVLRLEEDGNYTVQVFAEEADAITGKTTVVEQSQKVTPLRGDGQPFSEIPLIIFGPENNDPDVDNAPLDAISSINIAHYRNSADYEDACFIAGQPTPVFSGLTEEWVRTVLKGRVFLGSRSGIMLPKGATSELLQPSPNSMPKEAMDLKEGQMRSLGAKLVEERSIRRTATEATQDEASETSILSSATKNVTSAYNSALGWCLAFTATPDEEFEFELNSDFDLSSMTPAERQQLIAEWQAEAITWSEMRRSLKRGRIATLPDDEAREIIASNPPPNVVAAAKEAELAAKVSQQDNTNPPNGA